MARLKVYTADIGGVHQWIVAAPSQKAAAEAWGVDADVFSRGGGHETRDVAAVEAALARPGTALRRVKGRKGAFKPVPGKGDVESWALAAEAADAEPQPRSRAKGKSGTKPKDGPARRPSRAALDRAEAALSAFDEKAFEERQVLKKERARLEARSEQLEARLRKRRDVLVATRDKARAAFRKAGGFR